MKKILIAIDYEHSAEKVAEAGYAIAKAIKAALTIVHVISEPAYYNIEQLPLMGLYHSCNTGVTAIARDLRKEAEKFLAASVQHLGDSSITSIVLEGETGPSILKYSQDWKADLLVMGSHRHHGLDRFLITHVTRHILTQSKIPLLTIPTGD